MFINITDNLNLKNVIDKWKNDKYIHNNNIHDLNLPHCFPETYIILDTSEIKKIEKIDTLLKNNDKISIINSYTIQNILYLHSKYSSATTYQTNSSLLNFSTKFEPTKKIHSTNS